LLVGSDSRAGDTAAQAKQFGNASVVTGQRSDVIILVHVDPSTGKAAMLSIPRDTFVPIAGTGGSNKINSAFNSGPGQLVQTISHDFHISVNHFLEVDFSGLKGLVNTVGGVCMHFPFPVRDGAPPGSPPGANESGLKEPAGNDTLNGTQALSLVRSRYYQYEKGGQWIPDGLGDISRIDRQHEFLRALATKAIHDGIRNPITANSLLSQAVHDVTRDSGLTPTDLLRLIGEFHSLRPSTIPSWTLPTVSVANYRGYGDVLMPQKSEDAQVIAAWESYGAPNPTPASTTTTTSTTTPASTTTTTTQPILSPSSVSVDVLNGSGATGQATQAAAGLRSAGFTVISYGDASSYGHATSTVAYGPGNAEAAATVASYVEGGATPEADASLGGSTVVLTTGSSFTGVSPTPLTGANSSSSTSSTTSPTSTTVAPGQGSAVAPSSQGPKYPWDPTPC
ncbi:MAG: LCP family protein, partial [Acidimicrobiales bacterium]